MGDNDILGALGDLVNKVTGAGNNQTENAGKNDQNGSTENNGQTENTGSNNEPKATGTGDNNGKTETDGKTENDGKDNNNQTEKKDETIDKVNDTIHEINGTIDAFSNLIDAVKKQDATITLKEVCAPTKLGEQAFHQLESLDMSKLIGAPINAAIDAHYNAAKKALECINDMGVKDGTLSVVTFNFFRNGKMAKMSIPLLTLVPIATMRIKEMTYDFKVKINTDSSINLVTGNENTFSYGVGLNNGKSEQKAKTEESKKEENTKTQSEKGTTEEAQKKAGTEVTEETKKEGTVEGKKDGTNEGKKEGANEGKKDGKTEKNTEADTAATAVKNAARVEPTFGVSFSSKKDSKATQNSKYSVETSMDIKLTVVSDENMPAGVSRMLEILNNSVEVYNPNGELSVSSNTVKISEGFAVVSVVYMDGEGCLALDKIKCKGISKDAGTAELLNGGDKVQILFNKPGTYIISADKLQSSVTVENA